MSCSSGEDEEFAGANSQSPTRRGAASEPSTFIFTRQPSAEGFSNRVPRDQESVATRTKTGAPLVRPFSISLFFWRVEDTRRSR